MVSIKTLPILSLVATTLFSQVDAHKVVDSKPAIDPEVAHHNAKRSLSNCQAKLQDPAMMKRRSMKRDNFVKRHFEDKLMKRSIDEHDIRLKGMSKRSTNTSSYYEDNYCILTPENTIGPYYLEGELIRDDIIEEQPGIELLLDIQVVDVNTCETIPDNYLDIWHCNSTGVYSGVTAEDTVGSTFLRGISSTDDDGVMQMKTIFPGWYQGRATHVHVVSHNVNTTQNSNQTISGGNVNHIGQIFYDEDLLDEVYATYPYNTTTVERTANADDMWFPTQNSSGYNAIMTVEQLGSDITDGLIGYITVGIDPSADYDDDVSVAESD